MTKDYQQKEPTKFEKYVEYRFQTMEQDLINLQRQISTIARLTKLNPEDFIKGLNDGEAYKKFIEDLNNAYTKFREANPATKTKEELLGSETATEQTLPSMATTDPQ